MRLVGRAVFVGDEMDGGVVDIEVLETNARAPEAEQAEAHGEPIDAGVWGFAGSFVAVNDYAAGFGFEVG